MGPYDGAVNGMAGYALRGLLGASEFTETHRARMSRPEGKRAVALKVLRIQALPKDHAALVAQRFLAAGRLASSLSVPGMASVVDTGNGELGPYIATELVPGIDLAGVLGYTRKRSPGASGLAPSFAGAIAAEVAHVLATAHGLRAPLHHLALGPGNVRIMANAQVKVLDFGHAVSWRGLEGQLGRACFMAPEVLRVRVPAAFEGNRVAADVYSLGRLLHFLLAGRLPFQAGSFAELLAQVEQSLPDPPGIPTELARTVQALTSPNPDHRPASATEVVDLLGGSLSPEQREQRIAAALQPLHVRWGKKVPASGVQRRSALVARPRSRSRRLIALLGASVVFVLVMLAVWLRSPTMPGFRRADRNADRSKAPANASAAASLRMAHLAETDIPIRPAGIDAGLASGRVYVPMPKRALPRVPNHLNLDTTPTGADVWVDGVLRGKTPVDLLVGPGGHRVVLLRDGQRMHKAVYDTTEGEWIRVPLQAAPAPTRHDANLSVVCRSGTRLPIFIDDEDVGRLCPASMVALAAGLHKIGVFVPSRRAVVETEVEVTAGSKPVAVVVKD